MQLSQPGVTLFTPPLSSSSFLIPPSHHHHQPQLSINFSHNSSKTLDQVYKDAFRMGSARTFLLSFPPSPQLFSSFTLGISGQCTKQLQLTPSIDDSERSYERAQNNDFEQHESSFGHEALAGAASFGAFKIFEDRQRKEGPYPAPTTPFPPQDPVSTND